MRRRGRREGLKGRRPRWTVVGRVRIRVGMTVRGRMRMGRMRRRWPVGLVEVRIILIHHIGAAHHPARARHPRAGLQACVSERRTTPFEHQPRARSLSSMAPRRVRVQAGFGVMRNRAFGIRRIGALCENR